MGWLDLTKFLLVFCLGAIVFAAPVFAGPPQEYEPMAHDAEVTLSPDVSNCSDIPTEFTVNVENTSGFAIYDVKIAKTQVNIDTLTCGDPPSGWNKIVDDQWFCHYRAIDPTGDATIELNEDEDFTFDATLEDPTACASVFTVSTLDNEGLLGGGGQGEEKDHPLFLKVDCTAPLIYKDVGTPKIAGDGFDWWITYDTLIEVDAYDLNHDIDSIPYDECNLGLDYCEWRYRVDGGAWEAWDLEENGENISWDFSFDEDSVHDIEVRCVDDANNWAYLTETDRVDDTPPETTKTLGDPKYVDGYREWITTSTPITLNAVDPDPTGYSCNIGVDKTWYLDVIDLTNNICNVEEACVPVDIPSPYADGAGCIDAGQNWCTESWVDEQYDSWESCVEDYAYFECGVDPLWKLYGGTPIYKNKESCHLLQYFSVDHLGNAEDMQMNCFFVEDTPPILWKEHDEGMIEDQDAEGVFHWMTQDMAIDLYCSDTGDHPVNNVSLWYRIWDDVSGTWTEWVDPVAPEAHKQITFGEDSVHKLQYYCEDALGNSDGTQADPYEQRYKVDSTPPSIEKYMFGSYLGDCPLGTDLDHGDCYVADNGTSGVEIFVTDGGPICAVDDLDCHYELWWQTSLEECDIADGDNYLYGWCLLDGDEFSEHAEIFFTEDSTHMLYVYCEDALGNWVEDTEEFLVDSTPPETTKEYGSPYLEDTYPKGCIEPGVEGLGTEGECGFASWITTHTPITLTAEDEKVGVDEIYWRNLLIDNDDVCGYPWNCHEDFYTLSVINPDEQFVAYEGPFYKNEESCHVIEYYSVDKLGNEEQLHWQCVFVDDTAPLLNKVIGGPSVEGFYEALVCVEQDGLPEQPEIEFASAIGGGTAEERTGDTYAPTPMEGKSTEIVNVVTPCDSATAPNQCAYVPSGSVPAFVADTMASQGATNPDCGNILILSTGNPLEGGSVLSTGMGNGGCGTNPDGYTTYDCTILPDYMPEADSLVLAISSEWPEYAGTNFTDWMQIGGIVDMSINSWAGDPTLQTLGYGPSNSGTVTLATLSSKQQTELKVADSGDSIYDTAMIVVPLECFEEPPQPQICGNGELEPGEECDDGNNEDGDGCSANCFLETDPVCGNGVIEFGEDCDDGNLENGDGCDEFCQTECVEELVEMPVTYISSETPITISCWDGEPHPADHVQLWYRYRWSEDCVNWEDWTQWIDPPAPVGVEKTIYFEEDSCHELEYYCIDGLGNTSEVFSEIDIVDNQAPEITKTVVGPQYGDCPPEEEGDKCYIDGVTEIHVDAVDPEPHPVNDVYCDWEYVWDSMPHKGGIGVTPPFVVTFGEDSAHELHVECWDALGNTTTDVETFLVDHTPPETLKMYGQPRYPVEIKLDDLCYKDGDNSWQCYTELPGALGDIGYTELPTGTLTYKESGPVLEIIVELTGLKPDTAYQLTLNGRDGGDGNDELGTNCANPSGPKEGYEHAWECGYWSGGTGTEGFWNFDMTATADGSGNYAHTYYLMMPEGHYGVDLDNTPPFGVGFIVKEAADVPGGSNYPPILMETSGLDWTVEPYTYPLWINSQTPIMLTATDKKSGVAATYWRNTIVDDQYCMPVDPCEGDLCIEVVDEFDCMMAEGSGEWNLYEGAFNKPEESCHLIEYYSTDNVGKTEEVKKQCVFVDNTPPTPLKTVGDPKTAWDGKDAYFYDLDEFCQEEGKCWKVTMQTPITLDCTDPEPHPVDNEKVCFKIELDGTDATENYCKDGGTMQDNGYCCFDHTIEEFYFTEESEHNLKYYCKDALDNTGLVDDEKFKVEGTKFEIPLYKKWNLISVPFTLLNNDPEEVFKDTAGVDSVWTYDTENDKWLVYSPDGPSDLDSIKPGWGYWVMELLDEEWMVLGGSLMPKGPGELPGRQLVKGWNLIGYYGTKWQIYDWGDFSFTCGDSFQLPDKILYGSNAYTALYSLVNPQIGFPGWSSLWSYINCGNHVDAWIGLNACADESSPHNFLDTMYAGRGYWIELHEDDYYSPTSYSVWNENLACVWAG